MNPTLQQLRAAVIAKVPEKCFDCGKNQIDDRNCIAGGNHSVRHGREITLADVLRAIATVEGNFWGVDCGGGFFSQDMGDGSPIYHEPVWNLALSLEDQEQPAIDFIASILITNK